MIVVTSVKGRSVWKCDYWYGGGCSQREFASKRRATVLCRWWLAPYLNQAQLDGCPDPLWYLTSELGLKAICIFFSYLLRRVLGAHLKYVFLCLTTSWVSSLAARLDGALVWNATATLISQAASCLSWLTSLLQWMCSLVASAGNQLLWLHMQITIIWAIMARIFAMSIVWFQNYSFDYLGTLSNCLSSGFLCLFYFF